MKTHINLGQNKIHLSLNVSENNHLSQCRRSGGGKGASRVLTALPGKPEESNFFPHRSFHLTTNMTDGPPPVASSKLILFWRDNPD